MTGSGARPGIRRRRSSRRGRRRRRPHARRGAGQRVAAAAPPRRRRDRAAAGRPSQLRRPAQGARRAARDHPPVGPSSARVPRPGAGCQHGVMGATEQYREARDLLISLRGRHDEAVEHVRLARRRRPLQLGRRLVRRDRRGATTAPALSSSRRTARASRSPSTRWPPAPTGSRRWLAGHGRAAAATRCMLMLGNQVELWESMLAVMKLGAVIMPTTTAARSADLGRPDRARRCAHVVANAARRRQVRRCRALTSAGRRRRRAGGLGRPARRRTRVDVGADRHPGDRTERPAAALLHLGHHEPAQAGRAHPASPTRVGHLSTMYWLGLQPGDVHLNIRSPGWAKHAWSCFFAPWIAEATIFVYNYARFDAGGCCSASCATDEVTTLLRAADGVADAHQRRPVRRPRVAARGHRCRRAAQPRGHRAGREAPGG